MPRQMPNKGCLSVRNQLVESGAAQARHGVVRRAHARQQHARRALDDAVIGGDHRVGAEARERRAQRGDVGAAAVDDDDAGAHRTPLVDGSSSPSRRNAWRSARPTPLKQASIMWCVFSPVMVTWTAALRLSASD